MVDRNFPDRIALVHKEAQTGTTVDATVHQRGWVPLRSALGLALGDWLLLAEKNVLVAGLSDQYLLTALARAFSRLGVTRLALNDTSFLAVGGACGMMPASKALEGRAKVKCVVALDSDERGCAEQQRLSKAGFPIEDILCAGDFIEEPGAITLGDLAPAKLYLEAARRCYKRVGEGDWLPGELDPNRPVVQQLSRAIEERSGHGLDELAVAVELAQMLRTDPSLAKEGDGETERQPIVRLIGALGELLEGETRAKVEEKYGFVGAAEVRKGRESSLMQARRQLQPREKATVPDKESETVEQKPGSIAADQAP